MNKKIFSGVQPTGNLHLGNYLGAIKNFVELHNDHHNNCVFCVVDLHAITVKQDPKELRNNIRETVATFIACGINPNKSIIFNQSAVGAHAEAAWILSCVARMGWLNRMTQFKEKAGKDKEKASIGLYSYPVLMAADILLYDTTHVPVGDDQKQHLELCRDIAKKFNTDFEVENFLQIPEPLIQKEFSRIMSLKDASKKMSKSELSDLSRINLTDNKDQIINKIKKAKTDTLPMPSNISELSTRIEAKNLMCIFSSLTNSSLEKTLEMFSGKNFSEFKDNLSEVLINKIYPISLEIKKLIDDKSYLDKILQEGSEKANLTASKKINKIREIVGFL
ncbi:MAG: tryptophan--tRNA ligase [Pelagibacteraceae bacterium]|nr:tryptophan--tRNA ligase [Pelagibacteraceae bacterium]PHX89055.1 MAG: tryptophan--tRNA ligase [Pelagibacteraceae bacterium]